MRQSKHQVTNEEDLFVGIDLRAGHQFLSLDSGQLYVA